MAAKLARVDADGALKWLSLSEHTEKCVEMILSANTWVQITSSKFCTVVKALFVVTPCRQIGT